MSLTALGSLAQSGKFTLKESSDGMDMIKHAHTVFVCNEKEYVSTDLNFIRESVSPIVSTFGSGTCRSLQFQSDNKISFGIDIITYDTCNWTSMNAWVKNTTDRMITFNRVALLDGTYGPEIKGNWRNTRVLCGSTDKLEWLGDVANSANKQVSARSFMGLYNKDSQEEYTIGYSIKQAWGSCSYDLTQNEPKFTASVLMDVDLQPGEIRYAEALHIKKGKVWGNLQDLISATGKEVGAITDGKSFAGWCTWYGFNPFIDNDITEDVVVNFARKSSQIDDLPFELMLLDDGYFTLPGDWTTLRPFFPRGMRYLADECKKNGLIPGLWIASTLVHENSKIIKEKPEWVDRKKDGSYHHLQQNWGGKTHSFDATNKEFLEHIDTLFRHIAHDWGFQYLKLDFNVEPGENRSDRSMTSFQAIRNFYRVIQNAVGDSVFIANCAGTPYSPVIGYAKAGRVGPDVNPNWPSVLEGCRQSILHIPFHRRWWVNDPDCLNMREKRSGLTEDELRMHVTANFMGGGYVLFSDSLEELTPKRHRMLAQALPTAGKAAEIADYMTAPEEGIPSLFYYPINRFGEESSIITLFNWSDSKQNRCIQLEEVGLNKDQKYHVYDFWTDSYMGIVSGEISISAQKPHSCLHLAVRPVMNDGIQIISTDLHLLQGEKEIQNITRMNTSPFDAAKAEMWIELSPVSLREGKLILHAADGLRIAAVQGAKANLQKRTDGLWDLHLSNMDEKVAVLLRVR